MSLLTKKIKKAYKNEQSVVLYQEAYYRVVLETSNNTLYVERLSPDRMNIEAWSDVNAEVSMAVMERYIINNLQKTNNRKKKEQELATVTVPWNRLT